MTLMSDSKSNIWKKLKEFFDEILNSINSFLKPKPEDKSKKLLNSNTTK